MKLDSLFPPIVLGLVMGWGGKWPGSERCPSCNGKTYLPSLCASEQIAMAGPATGMPPAALLVCCGLAALRAVAQHLRHHWAFQSPNLLSVCWDLCPQLADSCSQRTTFQRPCKLWGCAAGLSAIYWHFTSLTAFRQLLGRSLAFLSLIQSHHSGMNSICCCFPLILVHIHTLKSWNLNMLAFPFVIICEHSKVTSCNTIHITSCNILEKAIESDFNSYFSILDLFGVWVFSLLL